MNLQELNNVLTSIELKLANRQLDRLDEASGGKFKASDIAKKLKWKDRAKVGTLGKDLSISNVEMFDVTHGGAVNDLVGNEKWKVVLLHGWGEFDPDMITVKFDGPVREDPSRYFSASRKVITLKDAKRVAAEMIANYMNKNKASGYKVGNVR